MKTKIAFQGEPGAYSHEAIISYFGPHEGEAYEILPCRTFKDVFERAASGEAAYGLLPIENSLTGSVYEVYDLLLDYSRSLAISGEVFLEIRHALLGLGGSRLEGIEHVYSHPQALWQCEAFLEELGVERHAFYDTAGAAKWVAEQGDLKWAAIASRLAARLYGLKVLRAPIATDERNTTRFIIISQTPSPVSPDVEEPYKTSLVVELAHRPGALYRALEVFARRGINLTKLESRPLRIQRWRYRFYLDFEGHMDAPNVQGALRELKKRTVSLLILGSYSSQGSQQI